MQIDVRIEGLEKLQAGAAAAPATLLSETRTALTAGSVLVEGTARSLAPKDTGRLGGSITHQISGLTSRIGPSVAYGLYVEKGRRPGKPPPVSAIEPWARRRGANPFLVARAIGRRGTKPRPFLVPALTQSTPRIVALFAKVGLKVVSRMAGG